MVVDATVPEGGPEALQPGAVVEMPAPAFPVAGLWPTSSHEDRDAEGDAHYAETIIVGDLAINANSFSGFSIYRGVEDRLRPVLDRPLAPELKIPRCTTLAYHEASSTLYCAAADDLRVPGDPFGDGWIFAFDLTDPEEPALRQTVPRPAPDVMVADAEVMGDVLLLATFGGGLFRAAISADGTLATPTQAVAGDFVEVVVEAERIYALEAELGIFVFDSELVALSTSGPLPGAPLDLHVHEGRVAVALGSRGAQLFQDEGLELVPEAALRPRCSVTSVASRGDALAVGCASGLLLYDLRGEAPRVAGFERARATILDVNFLGDGLVVLDWNWIWRSQVDVTGEALNAEISGFRLVEHGDTFTIGLRSHGELPLVVDVWVMPSEHLADEPPWLSVALPPGEDEQVFVTPAELAGMGISAADDVSVITSSRQLQGWRALHSVEPDLREFATRPRMQVLRRLADDSLGQHPVIGDLFPALGLTDLSGEPVRRLASGTRRVTFTNEDCAAMWHELRDLAARAREGEFEDETPLIVFQSTDRAFAERYHLGALQLSQMGPGVLYLPAGVGVVFGDALYEQAFRSRRAIAGAYWTTGYDLDPDGRVVEVDRVYRGAYPL